MRLPIRHLIAVSLAMGAIDLGLSVVGNSSVTAGIGVALFGGIGVTIAWLGILSWSLVLGIKALAGKRWLLAIVCPVIPIAAAVASYLAIPYAEYPQDRAHFEAMRPTYEAAIARLPKDGHRYAEFNWGGLLFASKGVVYDETDEVALPYGHQSLDWKRRMRNTDLTCGGDGPIGEVMPLGDHYYIASFGC